MRNPSTSEIAATNKSTVCCSKVGMKRGPWTQEEDELLTNYINREGEGRWRTLPKSAGLLRCGKSCRLRWMNYLRPSVKRGQIAPDEEDLILRLHRLLGNRWSLIAGRIPGRTDNEIKNYWNTHLSKKLIRQGIDPRTHKPLNQSDSSVDHHANPNKKGAVSSKAIQNTSSNPNPVMVVPSDHLEESNSKMFVSVNKESGYLPNTSFGYSSLLSCDHHDSGLGLGSNVKVNVHEGISNEEDEDINYCTDDVFSSFLNSLISEDDFASQHQQQVQYQQPNGNVEQHAAGCGLDPLVSIAASVFGDGSGWESAIMSSSSFNQNVQKRVNEHVE